MRWLLFFCVMWEIIATVAGMPIAIADQGATVVFDEAGPLLVVSSCVELSDINLRTFDRVVLTATLDCSDKNILIKSGRHTTFFAREKTLNIANTAFLVEAGADLTFQAEEAVSFQRGSESGVMFIVAGALNIFTGGYKGGDVLTLQNVQTPMVTIFGDGALHYFKDSAIDESDDVMAIKWSHDMGTDFPAVHSSRMVTVDLLNDHSINSAQLNKSGKNAVCGVFNIWCRAKAMVKYVYLTLKDFAFGTSSSSSSSNNSESNDGEDEASRRSKETEERRGRRFVDGVKKFFGRVAQALIPSIDENAFFVPHTGGAYGHAFCTFEYPPPR